MNMGCRGEASAAEFGLHRFPSSADLMFSDDNFIKRRQHMVRSLREAGVSFDEIVAILRVGSRSREEQEGKEPGYRHGQAAWAGGREPETA